MPSSEIRSSDFQMKANGNPVPVWHCRVSAVPMNLGWPDHQRRLEQTEPASFAFFDFSAPVTVEIRVLCKRIEKVEIRPAIYGIQPLVEGDLIRFTLDKPRHFTLEINGFHNALHIFSSHIKKYEISQKDPNVIYFSPGVHQAGAIHLSSGQTVYLAPGAVVYGGIYAENAENIRVLGRGILDCSLFPRADGTAEECFGMPLSATICLKNCKNVTIDGVICRDSSMWTIVPNYCVNVSISDVKLIGLWRYNTNGIDICNSKQVRLPTAFCALLMTEL